MPSGGWKRFPQELEPQKQCEGAGRGGALHGKVPGMEAAEVMSRTNFLLRLMSPSIDDNGGVRSGFIESDFAGQMELEESEIKDKASYLED